MDAFLNAAGPVSEGCHIATLPFSATLADLRDFTRQAAEKVGVQMSDQSGEAVAMKTPLAGGPVRTSFAHAGKAGVIIHPDRYRHETSRILSRLLKWPVLVCGNMCDYVWWYLLFLNGHLLDRHCSVPERFLEEMDGDDYLSTARRERKLHHDSWKGRPSVLAKAFSVPESLVKPYLMQFTQAEIESLRASEHEFIERKGFPDDRFSLASQWAFADLLARMGMPGIVEIVQRSDEIKDREAYALYSPTVVGRLESDAQAPECASYAWQGVFTHHDGVCTDAAFE